MIPACPSLACRVRIAGCLFAFFAAVPWAHAQSADNLLLVINSSSQESVQVGEYYARKRGVSADRTLRLPMDQTEQVTRSVYDRQVEAPIASWLTERGLQDRILYIVLTKGVPLRIAGTSGRAGTVSSVDSELALLYRRLTGRPVPLPGSVPNPYFLGDRPVKDARRFTHETVDIFLVTRLDGFSVSDIAALIDRGIAAVRTGRIALDEKASLVTDPGNRWLERSADLLRTMGQGDRVVLDTTGQVLTNQRDLLGYYSWGSNDPALKTRDQKLEFVPGALAGAFVSTDGRTFKEPPASWTFGNWDAPKTFFAGSPQSLAGDLIRQGVTGVAGHVAEPFLDATIRPDVLFPAYLSGFNLAESFYLSMPYVGWQTVIVGDPLVAPFRQQPLSAQDIDRGLDSATELPTFFAARAIQAVAGGGVNLDALRFMLRGQTRLARNDLPGARDAFEQATRVDARLVTAHLLLAGLYERANEHETAIDRYRRVLAIAPDNVSALNNLAYALATQRRDALEEATMLARKANTLAPRSGPVLDTMAWVLHLSGDDRGARAPAAAAVRLSPDNAQIQFHAAVIDAANGAQEQAGRELARAMELDPAMEKLPEVQALRATLGVAKKP